MTGTSLNQYQITDQLGAGGMGEVFRARDTRLNREVAVKVLPKDFVADADRLRRFEQEAKTLAALNHPNILTIHDAGVHEGAPYLVSELLEGQTLRELLGSTATTALPVRKATEYALQIAHGLAAAHGKGVIHRDLKPENVFVTTDGRVKILDFGLAKLRSADAHIRAKGTAGGGLADVGIRAPDAEASTLAQSAVESTEPGMVLGTPAYMAPEQVRGEPADHRADIFAFGCVLYEMLSGARAFRRDTPVQSMNAVLSEEPPELATLRPDLPPALARIVHRCLEKQLERRFHSAHDLAFALESLAGTGVSVLSTPRGTAEARKRFVAADLAILAALSFALLALWKPWKPAAPDRTILSGGTSPPGVRRFDLELVSPGQQRQGNDGLTAVISPDGRKIAYVNVDGLWLYSLERGGQPVRLAAGERFLRPFWSPQSTDVAYFDRQKLLRVSLQGGRPQVIASAPIVIVELNAGGAWLPDERIIFASGSEGLGEVSSQGGLVSSLWDPKPAEGEKDIHHPNPLPGGRGVLLVLHRLNVPGSGTDTIAVWKRSGERKIIWQLPGANCANPVYSPSGHVVFGRRDGSRGVWAFPFSLEKLERTGEAFLVSDTGDSPSVAEDGTLVLGLLDADAYASRQLVWVDRSGRLLSAVGPVRPGLSEPTLSPDGKRVAVIAGEHLNAQDVWMIHVEDGSALPLTRDPEWEHRLLWQRDGRTISFERRVQGTNVLISKSADGIGGEEVLFQGAGLLSPSRRFILFDRGTNTPASNGHSTNAPTPVRLHELRKTFENITGISFSPDERWLAFGSSVSGSSAVWTVDFPGLKTQSRVSPPSTGGRDPRWHPNGQELFFLSLDGRTMMSARRRADGGGFEEARKVFDVSEGIFVPPQSGRRPFDVSADGQRFLMLRNAAGTDASAAGPQPNVRVVLNWFEEFREKK
jgi:eukaryotic-like serine/threonine-protein kinase